MGSSELGAHWGMGRGRTEKKGNTMMGGRWGMVWGRWGRRGVPESEGVPRDGLGSILRNGGARGHGGRRAKVLGE